MLFLCLFTLYWVAPCVVPTITCTTNKRIIVIPWAVKAVTIGKAPCFLTAHYTGIHGVHGLHGVIRVLARRSDITLTMETWQCSNYGNMARDWRVGEGVHWLCGGSGTDAPPCSTVEWLLWLTTQFVVSWWQDVQWICHSAAHATLTTDCQATHPNMSPH